MAQQSLWLSWSCPPNTGWLKQIRCHIRFQTGGRSGEEIATSNLCPAYRGKWRLPCRSHWPELARLAAREAGKVDIWFSQPLYWKASKEGWDDVGWANPRCLLAESSSSYSQLKSFLTESVTCFFLSSWRINKMVQESDPVLVCKLNETPPQLVQISPTCLSISCISPFAFHRILPPGI